LLPIVAFGVLLLFITFCFSLSHFASRRRSWLLIVTFCFSSSRFASRHHVWLLVGGLNFCLVTFFQLCTSLENPEINSQLILSSTAYSRGLMMVAVGEESFFEFGNKEEGFDF
jgi:hypothetical protein